jgi:hypothetical protein
MKFFLVFIFFCSTVVASEKTPPSIVLYRTLEIVKELQEDNQLILMSLDILSKEVSYLKLRQEKLESDIKILESDVNGLQIRISESHIPQED